MIKYICAARVGDGELQPAGFCQNQFLSTRNDKTRHGGGGGGGVDTGRAGGRGPRDQSVVIRVKLCVVCPSSVKVN